MTRKKLRIGEILVNAKLITQETLEKALASPRPDGMRIGEFLVSQGYVRDEDVARAICKQTGIERYTPTAFPLNISLAEKIPSGMAQRLKAVPLLIKKGVLHVGMVDPLDIDALDKLEIAINSEVEPVICLQNEFTKLFAMMYGNYTGLDGVMQTLNTEKGRDPITSSATVEIVEGDEDGDEFGSPNEAPVVRLVNAILAQGVREGASDIHINPEKESVEVRFRIDGLLRKAPAVPRRTGPSIVSRIKILSNLDISIMRVPQDGRFTVVIDKREINVRVSTLPTIYGENVVMRLLDMSAKHLYTLPQLGMNEKDCAAVEACSRKPYGMILSTGPTGSGKSTSLYSILQLVNRDDINVITLEDPVEYRVAGIRQVQLNVRAGMTFASGLRAILRQDPDVIMVGEIRDAETAQIAVQAALTGHLVFSTLHTNDATGAVSRLIDMGVEPFLAGSVLLCSFAQRLVRKVCPHCRETYEPSPALLEGFGLSLSDGPFTRGKGCFNCGQTGFIGRTGVFEVLHMTPRLQAAVNKNADSLTLRNMAIEEGMKTLLQDARSKIISGITTVEEAVRVAMA